MDTYRPLKSPHTALLVIDFQERLFPAMQPELSTATLKNTQILIKSALILSLPIFVSEQYPKGLGPTCPEIKDLLKPFTAYEKITFSCMDQPELAGKMEEQQIRNVLVCGMETHVCVYQTVLDLLNKSIYPFVPADALCSRSIFNHQTGLQLMCDAGAVVGSTETFLFQLLEKAGSPEFKEISKLVK